MTGGGPALPPSDPPATLALLPRGAVAYVDEGPRGAPAIVLMHGIPGSVRDFRYLAPHLGAAMRAVRVDLPGFGESPPDDDAIDTVSGRARAVLALADHLGLARFAALGHSMGGATAIELARIAPERVALVVLVASVGLRLHRGLGMPPRAFAWLARGLRAPLLGRALRPLVRAAYRKRRFPGADAMDARDLAVQLRAIAAIDFAHLRGAVSRLETPALVAYAEDDHMVETAISAELAAALPRATPLVFADGGHNLQKTRAAELASAILAAATARTPRA